VRALRAPVIASLIVQKIAAGDASDKVGLSGRCSPATCKLHEDDSLAFCGTVVGKAVLAGGLACDRVTSVTSVSLIELDVVGRDEQPIEGLTLAVAYFTPFLDS